MTRPPFPSTKFRVHRVPEELRSAIADVQRWGRFNTEAEQYACIERLQTDPAAMRELESLGRWFTPHRQEVMWKWIAEAAPITRSLESRMFAHATRLLDALGILQTEHVHSAEYYLSVIQSPSDFVLPQDRANAAFLLGDFPSDSARSVSVLRSCTNSEHSEIRIASHYALFRLDGKDSLHIKWLRHEAENAANPSSRFWAEQCLTRLRELGMLPLT